MEVFLGRQPILSRQQRTVGYELLFRSGNGNYCDATDGNVATATVISNAFMSLGCSRALGSVAGFINFPRDVLVADQARLLAPNKIVIEILEDVKIDQTVIDSSRTLAEAGYSIALDDVAFADQGSALLPWIRYAKIDFMRLGKNERRQIGDHFLKKGVTLLAEKVETREDFVFAASHGYDLFQGYFFAKPEIILGSEIPTSKLNALRLLREIHSHRELDFKQLENLLRVDVGLVKKLFCFVNSAAFPIRNHIASISRALATLGEQSVRTWVSLSALFALADDKPAELVNMSLVRARFCELAAMSSGLRHRASDCFLMGLLSLLEPIVGRPEEELLEEMGLDSDVASAILDKGAGSNALRPLLELATALEGSEPTAVARIMAQSPLDSAVISELYLQAIEWADALHRDRQAANPTGAGLI